MYRELHSKPCSTNGRSIVAADIDAQVEAILQSLQLPGDWTERATAAFVAGRTGPSREALKERLRRLSRVYMYGEMPDDEFEAQRADIEAQLRQAESVIRPSHHEAAALFGDLPRLWSNATADEKQRIAGLLLDRVYIDLDEKLITAIVPTAELGLLLHMRWRPETAPISSWCHWSMLTRWMRSMLSPQASRWRRGPHKTVQETGAHQSNPSPDGMLEMVETGEN